MALAIAALLRETSFMFKQYVVDMSKSIMNVISTSKTSYQGGYSSDQSNNPYIINNHYTNGD
jgi:hypothetical protein